MKKILKKEKVIKVDFNILWETVRYSVNKGDLQEKGDRPLGGSLGIGQREMISK